MAMTAGAENDVNLAKAEKSARAQSRKKFEIELAQLINRYSMEYESGTPDFMLAQFLMWQLDSWNSACWSRDQWREATRG